MSLSEQSSGQGSKRILYLCLLDCKPSVAAESETLAHDYVIVIVTVRVASREKV